MTKTKTKGTQHTPRLKVGKATPGPWRAVVPPEKQPAPYCNQVIGIMANDEGYISVVANRLVDKPQWEANARLIAAAPDRLEACETAVDAFAFDCGDCQSCTACLLREAIDKARGKA